MAPAALIPGHCLEESPHTSPLSQLPGFFLRIASQQGEFVIYDDGWRGWTYDYASIARMSRVLAARLCSHGVRKGENVLIWSENRPGWVAALWACLLQGSVLVPVDPHSSQALFQRIKEKVEPRVLLLGDQVSVTGASDGTPAWYLREIESQTGETAFETTPLSGDDIAEIVFTSGTTAEPKGVLITHRNLAAALCPVEEQVAPYRKYLRFLAPLRILNLLPMSHLFGQALAGFLPPLFPAAVVFASTASPDEIARQIRTRRICALVAVPKVLEVLRDFLVHRFPEAADAASAAGPWPFRWWRFRRVHRLLGWKFCCLIVGGAPLPADLEQFWSKLAFVVVQGYGLTETAPIVSFSHPFHPRPGTAGKPLAGVNIAIAEDGEVLVRGDNVSPGYFQSPSATAAVFREGWFHTGDVGEFTPAGDLVIRGRKKEVIVTPEGLKVFPDDVEAVLNRFPGVRESVVSGKDRVHAVLVLEPDTGVQADEVVRQANARLEEHQKIRSFSIWKNGELPRTRTTGKLRRAEVAEILQTGRREPPPSAATEMAQLVQKYAPDRTITPDTTLDELGLSSLDRVELMLDLEEKLQTSIDESAFASVTKVADLAGPMKPATLIAQPAYSRRWIARLVRRIVFPIIFLPLTKLVARLKVSGLENLEALQGPVIFAANHQSHLDTPAILASLPRRWRYCLAPAMWQEYFDPHFFPERYPWTRRYLNTLTYRLLTFLFNAFPVPQTEAGTRQSVRYMGELVEEGWSILIFPEGERTLAGKIGRFFPGVGMAASRMQVPVVPTRLVGLDQVLPRESKLPRRGPVEVKFGAPMWLSGHFYSALAKRVEEAVRTL